MNYPSISAIICTYNRSMHLAAALESLCTQALAPNCYEVLVIDNGSTDDTATVVEHVQGIFPWQQIRYIYESLPGLSHARNRGYLEAGGRYIGYLDDDGKAPPEWLYHAQSIIDRHQPDGLGGPIVAFYLAQKPHWFKDNYGSVYRTNHARPLQETEFLNGGNMFFRRDLLIELGGFDTEFGMSGASIGYGEETDFQLRLRAAKPDAFLFYAPELYAYHLVRPQKWSWRWLIRSRFGGGRQHYHAAPNLSFQQTSMIVTLLRSVAKVAMIGWDLLLGGPLRDRARYPNVQNYWYEQTLRHVGSLGAYYEHVRSNLDGH